MFFNVSGGSQQLDVIPRDLLQHADRPFCRGTSRLNPGVSALSTPPPPPRTLQPMTPPTTP